MRLYALLTVLPFVCASIACALSAPERRSGLLRAQLDDDWKYWMTAVPGGRHGIRLPWAGRALDRLFSVGD